jgi:hypothetical protein
MALSFALYKANNSPQNSSSWETYTSHETFLEYNPLKQTKVTSSKEEYISTLCKDTDRFCDLVVRVPGYRPRGPGFDTRATKFSEK